MGLIVELQPTKKASMGFLGRILKKEVKELKSYATELSLKMEPRQWVDKDGKKTDDIMIML